MKKSNSLFRIFVFLLLSSSFAFFSCSSESTEVQTANLTSDTLAKRNNQLPAHSANVYDHVGVLHNELLSSYYNTSQLPDNLRDIMNRLDSVAQEHEDFGNLAIHGYEAPDLVRVNYILTHQITCTTDVISKLDVSVDAKTSLSNFISAVLSFSTTEDDYGVIYAFIVEYELDVIRSVQFNTADKEVLLTLSSIARHSLYAKKKRPKKNMDPDWDVLISNIIASTEGVDSGAASAVMYGLAAGIAEN